MDGSAFDIPFVLSHQIGEDYRNQFLTAFGEDTLVWRVASSAFHIAPDKGIPPFLFISQANVSRRELLDSLLAIFELNELPAEVFYVITLDHAEINSLLGDWDYEHTTVVADFFKRCFQIENSVEQDQSWGVSSQFQLLGIAPNPFNNHFRIEFSLSRTWM
jgi:hypothetical protein